MSALQTVTSRQNATIRHLAKLGKSCSYRRETGQFLAAGHKLLAEARKAGLTIEILATTDADMDASFARIALHIPDSLMQSISPLEDAPDVLFSASLPEYPALEDTLAQGSALLLDTLQDPGNVGAILRSGYAFGISCILLTLGCADVWSPKALRSAMGASFHLPCYTVAQGQLAELLAKLSLPLVGTAPGGQAYDLRDKALPLSRCVLALGNEGHGLSGEIVDLCSMFAHIPMRGGAESLGVAQAAAVCLWEMQNDAPRTERGV